MINPTLKQTLLMTGAAGFIGSHLLRQLLKMGYRVIGLDNFDAFYNHQTKIKNLSEALSLNTEKSISQDKKKALTQLMDSTKTIPNFDLSIGDICDGLFLDGIFKKEKIDLVVHLAALAGVRSSIQQPVRYQHVNVFGTQNLLERCKDYGIKKFVFASSSSVYGNTKTLPFREEQMVDKPISPYAATKKMGELMGHVYHKLYNIDMALLRFFTVYGPGQRPDLAIHKFTRLIDQQKPIPFFGDGQTARDYTYVDDIVQGITQAIDYLTKNKDVYEIINLGENKTITLQALVHLLGESLGKKPIIKPMPIPPGDVLKTYANIDKAKRLLGYEPMVSFNLGIDRFITWYTKQKT